MTLFRFLLRTKIIAKEISGFQEISIHQHHKLGRVLYIDGVFQTCEFDEYIYHEMITHMPIISSINKSYPEQKIRVLIIGGGDGGTLREVLKHKVVEDVVMVEIDEAVVRLCSEHLGIQGDYSDPRVKLIIGDGADYVRQTALKNNQLFDVIIVDSTDPSSLNADDDDWSAPANILYQSEFCKNCYNSLTETGVFLRHVGCPIYNLSAMQAIASQTEKIFPKVELYRVTIPTYTSGEMVFILSSKDGQSCQINSNIPFTGRHYNPEIHQAAFALPTWWKTELGFRQ